MTTVRSRKGKIIKVVSSVDQSDIISSSDAEMDARAVEAVKTAIEKAKFCKKPIAKYDKETKKVYVEYADGVRKYVE